MTLIAIDPGSASGAYALFDPKWRAPIVGDLEAVNKQLNPVFLVNILDWSGATEAIVENVHSMPRQGVASTFRFGVAVGIIHGVLSARGVPMHLVQPGVWKKALGLRGPDGEASRALAIRLYPQVDGLHLKKHHNRAEALLIGHYFREKRP